MTTYMVLAKKVGLEIAQYRSRAEGVLEKTREGILFTRIAIHVEIQAPAQRLEEARKMVETAKKYCIVTNALKLAVEVDAKVAPAGANAFDAGAA
jgi:organic hydroperoxide reductase OsmC/OhrA